MAKHDVSLAIGHEIPSPIAVFTRNHRRYLDKAVAISARNPTEMIVFRARTRWATALRELAAGGAMPIYMSRIGSEGMVEYVADLCDGELDPSPGDRRTETLLAQVLADTKEEGLWEEYGGVGTLYAIRACRRLEEPFPITSLVKVSNGKPISADYGYSYSIVHRTRAAN
jgi:hypothetical protein